jgi:hypothetical protein
MRLKEVTLSGLEISDLFFTYCCEDINELSIAELAKEFMDDLPSLKLQGYTIDCLVMDFENRL